MVISLIRIEKTVPSLCPLCLKAVNARLFQEGDAVYIEKSCEDHGYFKDIYWSDAALFRKFERYWCDGSGVDNSARGFKGCPFDCGLCENHKTSTLLGNIDVTSRCNLSCPVCFANAGAGIYEPSQEQIRDMMKSLRSERPVPCPAIQLSGGEPTVRDDLPQIVAMAKEMGFSQIQVATNGLRLAESLELCRMLERSGLNTVYLQFDGVTPEPYLRVRGRDLFPVKLRAIDNLRRAGQKSVVLVPTLAKGINDLQVGEMVRFASERIDIVKGVNFQPISFAGRADQEERQKKRITIPDLLALLEDQTDGEIARSDFYPVPFVVPISDLLAAQTGALQPAFTVHPCCGAATYAYCSGGAVVPITRFLDVVGLMESIQKEVDAFDSSNGSSLSRLKMNGMILKELPRFVDESQAPKGLNVARSLISVFRSGTKESLTEFHNKMLFLGAMHFQDLYNLDLERLQRCGVHYATPDGRIIPFCSYNTIHRSEVEERFSKPQQM